MLLNVCMMRTKLQSAETGLHMEIRITSGPNVFNSDVPVLINVRRIKCAVSYSVLLHQVIMLMFLTARSD